MREIVEVDAQSNAGSVVENGAPARNVEEAQGLLRHQVRRQRQPPSLQRHGAPLSREQPARRDDRDFGALGSIENEGMFRDGACQRPAKSRMEPERIWHGFRARIGRLQRPDERVRFQRVDHIQPEIEGVFRARLGIRLQTQSREIAALLDEPEFPLRCEAVQAERIGLAAMPDLAVARPADDREQDWRGLRPDGRIGRPKEVEAVDGPGERLRPTRGQAQARGAAGKKNVAQRWPVRLAESRSRFACTLRR